MLRRRMTRACLTSLRTISDEKRVDALLEVPPPHPAKAWRASDRVRKHLLTQGVQPPADLCHLIRAEVVVGAVLASPGRDGRGKEVDHALPVPEGRQFMQDVRAASVCGYPGA